MTNETIKDRLRIQKFLDFVNLNSECIKCITKYVFCLSLLNIFLCGYSFAGVWQDTFDDAELIGWERIAEGDPWNARWEVVDGILFSEIRKPRDSPRCEKTAADFLHWNKHQFKLDRLAVTGSRINYQQEGPQGMGELCLFMGKMLNIDDFAVEGYIFSPEETSKVTFSKKDDYSRGNTREWYGDKFQFTTRHLKAVFDSGQFQLFTDRVLLTEFVDKRFTQIDVVGLLVTCHFGSETRFGANIASFSVAGSGIPNHSLAVQWQKTKLTTIWGQLKGFE